MEHRQEAASHVLRTAVPGADGFFFPFYFQNSGSIESVLQRLSEQTAANESLRVLGKLLFVLANAFLGGEALYLTPYVSVNY